MHLFHLCEQLDPGGEGVLLHLELHVGVLRALGLFPAGLHPQLIAVDDVLDPVPLLHRVIISALGGAHFLLSLLQAFLQLIGLPADGLIPVQHFLGRGGQGGQQSLGLGSAGGAQVSPVPQLLQLPGQSARRASGLLRLLTLDLQI